MIIKYLVLCDHPKIKKGLSHGIAHKYYGPFIILGKNSNGCDYFIRLKSNPRARIKQVHKNRLKIYFDPGNQLAFIKNEEEENITSKRGYKKNPLNPRWKINQEKLITVSCDETNESSSCESNSEKSNNESNKSKSTHEESEKLNYDSNVGDNSEIVESVTKENKKIKKALTNFGQRWSLRQRKAPERLTYK